MLLLILLHPTRPALAESASVLHAAYDPLIGGRQPVLRDLRYVAKWDRVRRFMLDRENRFAPRMLPLFLWALQLRHKPVEERLYAINRRVNDDFAYESDSETWGRADYWATPVENLEKGRMDCEDFASLKLYLANIAGVDYGKLALLVGRIVSTGEIHVVSLAEAGGRRYLLDNRRPDIVGSNSYHDFDLLYAVDFAHVRIYRKPRVKGAAILRPRS